MMASLSIEPLGQLKYFLIKSPFRNWDSIFLGFLGILGNLQQNLWWRGESISYSEYFFLLVAQASLGPTPVRPYVTLSTLSASMSPHKALRLHCGRHCSWHGGRHGGEHGVRHGCWHGGGHGGWHGGGHNFDQISQFCLNFTILTKLNNFDRNSQSWELVPGVGWMEPKKINLRL